MNKGVGKKKKLSQWLYSLFNPFHLNTILTPRTIPTEYSMKDMSSTGNTNTTETGQNENSLTSLDLESSSTSSSSPLRSSKRSSPNPEPSFQKRTKLVNSKFDEVLILHEPLFDKSLPKNFNILDINKIEYATKNLQKSINTIIEITPDIIEFKKLNESNDINNGIKLQITNNELISLSSRLKTLYKLKKIPIFDNIINSNIELNEEDIENLEKISNLNDSIIVKLPKNETISNINIKGIKNNLPELPKINDNKLFERVFTHKSFVNNKNYLNNSELLKLHNERLEFLGDSILNNLVTLIIFKEFNNCNEGELSKIRASLICNKTLLKFAYEYGFDTRLKSFINKEAIKSGDQKIYADVFEAYIGALGIERGNDLKEVQDWLIELFEPLIFELKKDLNKEPLDNNAKSELYSLIGRTDMHPQYKVIEEGDGVEKKFIVSCMMNGEEIGKGVEKSIKDAGIRAAMEALKNKEMLGKYFLERQKIEKPVKQERMKRELMKKEARLKEMEQERINEKSNLPSTPPSPIRTDMFPIKVDLQAPIDSDSKGELYGLIGRKIGDKPEYINCTDSEGNFITELRIRGILICTTTDRSKKKSMARAALTLLNNKPALEQICKDFRTKDKAM